MREINQDELYELLSDSSGRILIDFFAEWCGPCKMFAPILEKVTDGRSDIAACKINVDSAPDACNKYGIQSIPTLVLFNDGIEIKRNVGSMSRAELETFIEE